MLKKILIISYIVLSTSFTHAADRWSGPTSPTDPMWGMKGSSLMAEALRDQSASDQLLNLERKVAIKEAYEMGKSDGQRKSNPSLSLPLGVDW